MNYQELVDAAKAYADRQDIEVSDNMDTFIIMAESRINRILKTREQTARVVTNTISDQEYYGLPPDYAGMRDIQVNSGSAVSDSKNYNMHYLNPAQFNDYRSKPFNEKYFYTIIADQFQIYPIMSDGQTIEIVYYQKVPNLNSIDSFNWLSISYPDIYLSGILAEIESFVKNYDVAKNWDSKMSRSLSELEESDVEERWSGSSLEVRIG